MVKVETREGCREHAVGKAQVEDRWRRAEERDLEKETATVSMCACCLGPARIGYNYCRTCGEAE